MRRRPASVRFLSLLWAALQLASPAVSSIADGRLALANASEPTTHVEATTSATCPVVHSSDCAVCRYLSGPASSHQLSDLLFQLSAEIREPGAESARAHNTSIALHRGRAPPTALNV